MFIFANLLLAIAKILDIAFSAYIWIVIISVILSWVNPDPYNPIVRFLRSITEPVYRPIRKVIGHRLGIIDISPMVVILAILFIKYFFIESLIELANKLKRGGMI